MNRRILTNVLLMLLLLTIGSAASASDWCGENGLIRLSFSTGEELQAEKTISDESKGVTIVDLYAFLTDVEPVKRNGEVFMGTGAIEFTLIIEGAEGFITSQEFPVPSRSVGRRPGEIVTGLDPGIMLEKDHTQLVHWQVLFQGTPKNVVFRLDPEGGISCKRTPGCAEARPYGLYTGTIASRQGGSIFGAGYVPAYLNFEGEADLTPQHGNVTWQDVGLFESR